MSKTISQLLLFLDKGESYFHDPVEVDTYQQNLTTINTSFDVIVDLILSGEEVDEPTKTIIKNTVVDGVRNDLIGFDNSVSKKMLTSPNEGNFDAVIKSIGEVSNG